ncbi:hypothetical protein T484DRAFT_1941514 [Baffinella frigidus]|nr:hypothetical protein T484DRAFT_1941514 [Cryptophyta sp. CCMP2293]
MAEAWVRRDRSLSSESSWGALGEWCGGVSSHATGIAPGIRPGSQRRQTPRQHPPRTCADVPEPRPCKTTARAPCPACPSPARVGPRTVPENSVASHLGPPRRIPPQLLGMRSRMPPSPPARQAPESSPTRVAGCPLPLRGSPPPSKQDPPSGSGTSADSPLKSRTRLSPPAPRHARAASLFPRRSPTGTCGAPSRLAGACATPPKLSGPAHAPAQPQRGCWRIGPPCLCVSPSQSREAPPPPPPVPPAAQPPDPHPPPRRPPPPLTGISRARAAAAAAPARRSRGP